MKHNLTVLSTNEASTENFGKTLGTRAFAGSVVCLSGDLGAGKTVLARGFARGLGIREPVTSPTYPIIQEYEGRLRLYHMDLYRLSGEDEAVETGMVEMLDGDGVCLVEWPERTQGLFGPECLRLSIKVLADGTREISADCDDDRTWSSFEPH